MDALQDLRSNSCVTGSETRDVSRTMNFQRMGAFKATLRQYLQTWLKVRVQAHFSRASISGDPVIHSQHISTSNSGGSWTRGDGPPSSRLAIAMLLGFSSMRAVRQQSDTDPYLEINGRTLCGHIQTSNLCLRVQAGDDNEVDVHATSASARG